MRRCKCGVKGVFSTRNLSTYLSTPVRRARVPPQAVTTPPPHPPPPAAAILHLSRKKKRQQPEGAATGFCRRFLIEMTPTALSTHRLTVFHARTTERAARAPRHDGHTTSAKKGPETGASLTRAPLLPAPHLSRLPAPRSHPAPNLARSSRARRFCSRVRRRPTAAVAGCSPPHARLAQPQSGAARQSCSFAQAPAAARTARRRAVGSRRRGEFNDAAARERVATLGAVRSANSAG